VVALADAVGQCLRGVNAAVYYHLGVAQPYPTIELIFDRVSLRLQTAGDGSLQPKVEALKAFKLPKFSGEVRLEDWSDRPEFGHAVGLELVWLQRILEADIECGAILNFAGGRQLWFMNVGDELWAGANMPPPTILDGTRIDPLLH
jgi:hypothetical protein